MLECPDCGVPNAATSTFCIRCGRELPVQLLIDEDVVIPEVVTSDGNALLDEAVESYAAGNLDDAAVACHKALDASPELVAARALLARVEEERGNLAAAAAEYEAVARLEPGRLVERERADKLRAELDRQAISADVLKDPSFDFRRRLPLIVGIAAAFLFLLISSLLLASRGNQQQQADTSGMNGVPGTVAGMPLNPNDMPAPALDAMGQPIDAGTGFTGPGIGMENGVEVQQQTNFDAGTTPTTDADGNYYPSPTNNNNNGVRPAAPPSLGNPPSLPPPTIGGQNTATGVLRLPPGASTTRPAPAPNASETSAPQPPRGRIRIWTGDEDEAEQSAPTPAPQSNAGNVQPGRVIAPGSWSGQSGTVVPTAPRNNAGQASAASATRSGSSTRTTSAGNRQFPAPTTNSGQAGGNTADSYRNKAQQALSSGRHNEAKDLFRSAMNSYEVQSQRDPGRAAVNRSAAESCRRALEVLDAGS